MSNFILRPATITDHDELLQIAENGAGFAEDLRIVSLIHPDAQVIVAEGGDGILGFICFYSIDDLKTGEAQGYIPDIAVASRASRREIGAALLQAAEDWCRDMGYRILALDVNAKNPAARAYYARRGFQEQTVKLVKVLEGVAEMDEGELPF